MFSHQQSPNSSSNARDQEMLKLKREMQRFVKKMKAAGFTSITEVEEIDDHLIDVERTSKKDCAR